MKSKIFVYIFAVLLGVMSIGSVIGEKKDFSENENRMLASFPELSFESVKNGSFAAGFTDYIADHFLLRDAFVSIKAFAETASLKMNNNGVWKGKDGYLIDGFDSSSVTHFDENIEAIKTFEAEISNNYSVNVKTIIAPTATQILKEKLPALAVTEDGEKLLSTAKSTLSGYVDTYKILNEHKSEYIYYKTDHHWTSLGAYYAYTEYMSALNMNFDKYEDTAPETVCDGFFGTTYSRFGLFVKSNPDTICAPEKAYLGKLTVTDSKGKKSDSVYHPEKLSEKDKYLYFLGGNDSLITIETDTQNGRTLLLIKDSYANSFLPYITNRFQKLLVVDMRYYTGLINELIEQNNVSDVLILYNLKSFCEDQYLSFINFNE